MSTSSSSSVVTSYISDLSSMTDPTDFPQQSLRLLDTISRCPICKEFFNTPKIGDCGHTYCSFCILRSLAIERNCAVCKKILSDHQLLKCVTTEKIVDSWKNIRRTILKGANEEFRKNKIRDYIRRSDNTTLSRTYSNLKSSSNGKKNTKKLGYTYLYTPESSPSSLPSLPSDINENQLETSYMKICIQQ
ncbi:6433_t:CDS:2 [Funneliformis caledonium]|uniref:Postreplication repair E3 ubiquitin-protein ligase RAD18 n=2 Tax=Funneliformis TaxID=1117308 RepID=A0A9N8ZF99_9GLOM|nr:5208_t:CDS:2 [Funneliformis mosseae]CAG8485407.1 6433_t:CDS:2 [Funneliformis caledonium]